MGRKLPISETCTTREPIWLSLGQGRSGSQKRLPRQHGAPTMNSRFIPIPLCRRRAVRRCGSDAIRGGLIKRPGTCRASSRFRPAGTSLLVIRMTRLVQKNTTWAGTHSCGCVFVRGEGTFCPLGMQAESCPNRDRFSRCRPNSAESGAMFG